MFKNLKTKFNQLLDSRTLPWQKFTFLPFLMLIISCTQAGPTNVLQAPKVLSIDKVNNRLFIVDSENNNLSLVDTSNNTVVTGQPLLNQNSTLKVPQLPQGIATINMGSGVTRLFIIGNGPPPRNRITVFDYSSSNGLQAASISPIIVGTDTVADQSDILGGVVVDTETSTVFVSNSTDGFVRGYDVTSGAEKAGSPLTVNTTPQGMGVNIAVHRLFVSSLDGTSISIINTQDLTQMPVSLNVNTKTSDVASSTNTNGTALFLINPIANQILIYNFNVITPNASALIGSPIVPPTVGSTIDANTILTGSVQQVAAATLSTNQIVGTITQSSGDLAVVDVAVDLSSYSAVRVTVLSGLGAYGVDILTDASGNGNICYFVSVSAGALSLVNVTNNQYAGQIL